MIILGTIIYLNRFMIKVITNSLIKLDNNLAEAIKKVVEGNFELPDQVNPIQQIFAEIMRSKMQEKVPNLEVLREKDGKFGKSEN